MPFDHAVLPLTVLAGASVGATVIVPTVVFIPSLKDTAIGPATVALAALFAGLVPVTMGG